MDTRYLDGDSRQAFPIMPFKLPMLKPHVLNQVQAGVRIDGGMQNADTVGTIVWAKSPLSKGAWWPAEVLDPFFMPFSHTLPPASVLGDNLS